ncbi:hypothetical protein ONZ45_g6257 [Pleurotus djamor]|nr:hypothetical protein ONZ45_g6257 [Pleurotus djamor]
MECKPKEIVPVLKDLSTASEFYLATPPYVDVHAKSRIVLGTSSDPLYKCPTVVTLFEVMYDVLEAHRFLVDKSQQARTLHRDIRTGYTLIDSNPNHTHKRQPYEIIGDDRPKYINQVLAKNGMNPPENNTLALIIDLDIANNDSAQIYERTETPIYAARSLTLRRILFENTHPTCMPNLPDNLRALYLSAYQTQLLNDPLRTLNDIPGTMQRHGTVFDHEKYEAYCADENECSRVRVASEDFENIKHHPRYAAESVFWCFLVALLQAVPQHKDAAGKEDVNYGRFEKIWKLLDTHQATTNDDDDDDMLLDPTLPIFTPLPWAKILHHDLSFVVPVVKELTAQVRPEYALLTPEPSVCHLHEAMQRILVKYVWMFREEGQDVSLGGSWRSWREDGDDGSGCEPNKRKKASGRNDGSGCEPNKRKKASGRNEYGSSNRPTRRGTISDYSKFYTGEATRGGYGYTRHV